MTRTILGALAVMVSVSFAQDPASSRFEVASVKPCNSRDFQPGMRSGAGGENSPIELILPCQTLRRLIEQAFGFFADGHSHPWAFIPILGGPAWIDSDPYEIRAKSEIPQSRGMLHGPMLQALLEDRFKLKVRRETRQIPIYALNVGKGGPKLQPFQEGGCIPWNHDDPLPIPQSPGQPFPQSCGVFIGSSKGFDGRSVTMEDLANLFLGRLDRNVVDETGIEGKFDVHLDLLPNDLFGRSLNATQNDAGEPPPASDPSLVFGAVNAAVQKLGLTLKAAQGPGEFLIIDHIERPTEN